MSGPDRLCRPAIDIPTLADLIATRAPLRVRTRIMGRMVYEQTVTFLDALDSLHLQQLHELLDAIDRAERESGKAPL